MESLIHCICVVVIMCEITHGQTSVTVQTTLTTSEPENGEHRTSNPFSSRRSEHAVEGHIADRLHRSRLARIIFLQRHVLEELGWTSTPDIDPETKRRLLQTLPVFVTLQKICYFPACDMPMVSLPSYMNRSIWFDTSSRNIRYFFNIQANSDPSLEITSAKVRLHLKRREDCPCAFEGDPITSRLHIKIYQYRKPIRSHSRLRHSNMRLIDATMVTWESSRWITLTVTDAVKRIISRGRRNGGFEVHVLDTEENVLDAKTIIDPTVCTPVQEYECTHEDPIIADTSDQLDPNYSPVLEISSTTTSRIDVS